MSPGGGCRAATARCTSESSLSDCCGGEIGAWLGVTGIGARDRKVKKMEVKGVMCVESGYVGNRRCLVLACLGPLQYSIPDEQAI